MMKAASALLADAEPLASLDGPTYAGAQQAREAEIGRRNVAIESGGLRH